MGVRSCARTTKPCTVDSAAAALLIKPPRRIGLRFGRGGAPSPAPAPAPAPAAGAGAGAGADDFFELMRGDDATQCAADEEWEARPRRC